MINLRCHFSLILPRLMLLLLFTLSLSACGGDSNSTNNEDNSNSVNTDVDSDPKNNDGGSDSENNGNNDDSSNSGDDSGPTNDSDDTGSKNDSDDEGSTNEGGNSGSTNGGDGSGSPNDSNVPHISVATPASGAKITEVIGGQYELSVDDSGVSDPFSAPVHPTLMMALDENEELAWLGIADQANESLTLGPESTAFSLVLLYPVISVAYSMSPELIREAIVATPEFGAFSDVLALTDDWAETADPIFEDAYASALVAAASAIEVAMSDAGTIAVQQKNRSSQLSATFKRVAPQQDSTLEAFVSVPENPNATRSGVQVSITGTNAPAIAPDTELNVTNQQRRWVEVIVSKNKDGSSDDDSFRLAPRSIIPWDGFLTTETLKYSSALIEDSSPLHVSVLGPSRSGIPDSLSPIQRDRALTAAKLTVITELVFPSLSIMFGSSKCAEDLIFPFIVSPTSFLSAQGELRNYLIAGDYGNAAGHGIRIIVSDLGVSTLLCAGRAVVKRFPLLTGIATKLQISAEMVAATPAIYQMTTAVLDVSQSQWHEQWIFNNETLADVDVTSETALRPLLAGYGAGGYVTTDKIPDEMITNYLGACSTEEGYDQCLGFTFANDPPWAVDFAVRCRHPDTNATVDCRKASIGSTTKVADSDGIVRRTIEFTAAREGEVLVEAVDTYGARKQQRIGIQIKQAQPQLEFETGNLSDFTVENGVLTVGEPLEFECCDAGQETVTKTITLDNTAGNSEARIISVPTSDTPGFSTTIPSRLTIPAGESASFGVTYDPRIAGEAEQTANISLFGHFGGASLSTLYKAEEYSTMVLPVKGKKHCGQGGIDARYFILGTQCEWNTLIKDNVKMHELLPSSQATFWVNREDSQGLILKISGANSQINYRTVAIYSTEDKNGSIPTTVRYRDTDNNIDYLLIKPIGNPLPGGFWDFYVTLLNPTNNSIQYELELVDDPFYSPFVTQTLEDSYVSDRLITKGYSSDTRCPAPPEYNFTNRSSNFYWHFEIEAQVPIDVNGERFKVIPEDGSSTTSSISEEFIEWTYIGNAGSYDEPKSFRPYFGHYFEDVFGRRYLVDTRVEYDHPTPGC